MSKILKTLGLTLLCMMMLNACVGRGYYEERRIPVGNFVIYPAPPPPYVPHYYYPYPGVHRR